MKQILPVVFLSFCSLIGHSQTNTIWGIYAGAGASTVYNYDVGISGGFDFAKQVGNRTAIGASLKYQSYAFLYDKEANFVNNGGGNAGVSILNKSSYFFVTPKVSQYFGKHGCLEVYVDGGAGFKMSGTETMRKWDYNNATGTVPYDSILNTSKNINSMVLRFGFGLTEYVHLSNHWWFTITEDCGFLGNTLSKTSNVDDPSRTSYSPNGRLNPNYFSLQIGIFHTRYWEEHKMWTVKW